MDPEFIVFLREQISKEIGKSCKYTYKELYYHLKEEDEVDEQFIDSFRWWDTYVKIVGVGGRHFGIEVGRSTGDESAEDMGYEPDYEIQEYVRK
jgi:hypothetical protein